jgi:hypothetical protein
MAVQKMLVVVQKKTNLLTVSRQNAQIAASIFTGPATLVVQKTTFAQAARAAAREGLKTKLFGLLAGISIYASVAQPEAALLITATGSGSDGPLAASADFTFGNGSLTVTLSNLLSAATIRSAGQTVSDLSFTLSNPPGTLGTTSAAGQLANIGSGGGVTNVAGTPTRWLGAGGQGDFRFQVIPSRWRPSGAVSPIS